MAVPKRRHSNARTGSRRAHDRLKPRQIEYCQKCSAPVRSHCICPNCGFYMGRTMIVIKD